MSKKFSWKDFATVFGHYIKKEIKSKAYIIVTIILCAASFASCFIVDGILSGRDKVSLHVIDETGMFSEYLMSDNVPEDYFEGVEPVLEQDDTLSEDDMLEAIEENGGAYAVFSRDGEEIKLTLYNNGDMSAADQTALLNLAQNLYTVSWAYRLKYLPTPTGRLTLKKLPRQASLRTSGPLISCSC